MILIHSLFNKRLIVDDIIWLYDIHVTHIKFLDKLCNLVILLNLPKTESRVRIILTFASDVPQVIRLEGPGTLKAISIYQYFSTAICYILPWINFDLETLHVGKCLLQSITIIREEFIHGDNKDLRYGCC